MIGSSLYKIGGFTCPFWTLGCVILIFAFILHFIASDLPHEEGEIGDEFVAKKKWDLKEKVMLLLKV